MAWGNRSIVRRRFGLIEIKRAHICAQFKSREGSRQVDNGNSSLQNWSLLNLGNDKSQDVLKSNRATRHDRERCMRREDQEEVRRLPLFMGVAEPFIDTLLRNAFLQRFPTHVDLVREREPADFLHMIVDGQVEVFAAYGDRETTVAVLGPGQSFIVAAVVLDRVLSQVSADAGAHARADVAGRNGATCVWRGRKVCTRNCRGIGLGLSGRGQRS